MIDKLIKRIYNGLTRYKLNENNDLRIFLTRKKVLTGKDYLSVSDCEDFIGMFPKYSPFQFYEIYLNWAESDENDLSDHWDDDQNWWK